MTFLIAIAQFQPIRKDVERNILEIQTLLKDLKADLVVLPELANSGYLYESPQELHPFTEPNDGQGVFLSSISDIARELNGVIVTGYAEKAGDRIFNSAAAVSADGLITNYRKIHLFDNEISLFDPGKRGFNIFEWKGINIGMMICFDWIFPEAARSLALLGAQIIAHPANLVLPYCQDAMITRSIENKVFTITANRIGTERLADMELTFTGVSQITNPQGQVLFRGPEDKATVHILSVDPAEALEKHISDRNDIFVDRKPQLYL